MKIRSLLLLLCMIGSGLFSQPSQPAAKATVYIFLSETCPICQSATLALKELYDEYHNDSVEFIGVFPNHYSDEQSIVRFKKEYSLPFDVMLDKNAILTKRFNALITPEVFVESPYKIILYSGRIDDSFFAIGKRKTVISEHDLADALEQITTGQKVNNSKTQAVGCVINTSE